jgi:hypothetical protein
MNINTLHKGDDDDDDGDDDNNNTNNNNLVYKPCPLSSIPSVIRFEKWNYVLACKGGQLPFEVI